MAKPLNLLDKSIPTWKLIFLLAWPSIIEQLLQTAVNYVDTAMVGSIGTHATAAIGVCHSTLFLLMGLMNATGLGFSVIMARRIGEGRQDEAREVIRQAMLAVIAVGGSLTLLVQLVLAPNLPRWMGVAPHVLPYSVTYFRIIGANYLLHTGMLMATNILRCMGDTKTPLKFNILTNMINVCGNFLLIYPTRQLTVFDVTFTMPGAGMGVAGAALATVISTAFSAICLLSVLFRRKGPLQISLRDSYRPRADILKQAVQLGVPTFLERATVAGGQIATTAMISGLGTVALAANQLALTGESICYMPISGFAIAATTLVAQNLGARDKDRAFQQGAWCTWISVAVIFTAGVIQFILSENIIDLFSNDPAVIALGGKMLRIEAFAEAFFAFSSVLAGVLRGAGDTRWPFCTSLLGMWCIRIPVAYTLIHKFHWGLEAIWVCMALDLMVRSALFLWRFYRKKWLAVWEKREAKLAQNS